jgi:hypothetical protein
MSKLPEKSPQVIAGQRERALLKRASELSKPRQTLPLPIVVTGLMRFAQNGLP